MKNFRARPSVVLALIVLFVVTLAGSVSLVPANAQQGGAVGPQPDGPYGLVSPDPFYYRPNADKWLGQLVATNSGLEVGIFGKYFNDPINVIVYMPPLTSGETFGSVAPAFRQLLLPTTNTQTPSLDNSVCDPVTGWCDAFHKWTPLEQGAPQLTCFNQLQISPVTNAIGPVGFYTTSPCPALGVLNGEPGTPATRNHFRLYVDPQFPTVGYISASWEENFAWPARCEIAAHCSLNFNLARDDVSALIVARAQSEGWGIRTWNLSSQYAHTNLQVGPYDGKPGPPMC